MIMLKMLICNDGSAHSRKAIQKALQLAEGLRFDDIALIYVCDNKENASPLFITSDRQEELIRQLREEHLEEINKMLSASQKEFDSKNIKTRAMIREGHPAHTIVRVAREENFDLIVIGSRGLSGIERVILGSVSNTVVQEAKNCCVLIVK